MILFNLVDQIIISQKQLEKLRCWGKNNIDLLSRFKPLLNEGIIVIEGDAPSGNLALYFKQESEDVINYIVLFVRDDETYHQLISIRYTRIHIVSENGSTWQVEEIRNPDISKEYIKMLTIENSNWKAGFFEDSLTVHSLLMTYIERLKSDVEITESSIKRKTLKMIESYNRYNHNNPVVIKKTKTVYSIADKLSLEEINKKMKKFTRRAESWSVIGHWRKCKSGKKVWVKPFKKGKGAKKVKTYKIEDEHL